MKRTFAPTGHLALLPAAFGFSFDECEPERPDVQGGTAIVKIRGPLMHHASWWGDSYDGITSRVAEALDGKPKALLLCVDSPGGTVSGLFECAASIREMAAARRVPVYAYVEGQACSAAYALACAADVIGCPPTAQVGSIGVIGTLYSVAEANAKQGVRVELVTSGARKADGNPHGEITPEAIAAEQASVDELAGMFFEHVAASRGISADAIRKLEAGVFLGTEAVERKLADQVVTFAEMLALVASAPTKERSMKAGKKGGAQASKEMDGAIETLRKLAESDDEEEAKKAKKLLAAFEEDEGEEEPAEDEEEANAKRALPLALKRLESLEAKDAEREKAGREARVESDIAAGKIATCDRETALEVLEKSASLYAKIYGDARAVPVGRVAKGDEARKAALATDGRIDEKLLSDNDALLVKSMRAAQLGEKAIKAALSKRGTEV